MSGESLTYRTLINRGATRLVDAGIENARLDAQILMAHSADIGRTKLFAKLFDQVSPDVAKKFSRMIDSRLNKIPVAYIVEEKEFYSLAFTVTPAVLAPRPETELLIDEALSLYPADSQRSVLDIGTGSGCIAVTLATHRPDWKITAVDISRDAIEIARSNASRHRVINKIDFVQSDIATSFSGKNFDLIVSNPPYIPDGDINSLADEVVKREPHQALFAGEDGLSVINRILADAPNRLAKNGRLLMEIGCGQADAVRTLVDKTNGLTLEKIVPDLAGIDRMIVAKMR